MMEHPKFIITDDGHLRLGLVTLHRDLLQPDDECLGGGFYEFDYVAGSLILMGKSFDYGYPRWDEMDVLIVPEAYRGLAIVYRSDSHWEHEIVLTSVKRILYE